MAGLSATVKRQSKRWEGLLEYREQTGLSGEGTPTWTEWTGFSGYYEEDSEQSENKNDTRQEIEYNSVVVTLTPFNNSKKYELRLEGGKTQVIKKVRRERDTQKVDIYTLVF